jgi:hypothetical protein
MDGPVPAVGGATVLVLLPTPGSQQNDMLQVISRVILTTDGDFNVGESSDEGMEQLIVQQREKGVFLPVLGVGRATCAIVAWKCPAAPSCCTLCKWPMTSPRLAKP